ncbi:MAG: TRAP transporter substrate-binding protein [Pseudomonadales bacterium]
MIPKKILIWSSIFAMLLGCSAGPETVSSEASSQSEPAQTYQWRLVTTWPKNLPGLGMAPEKIADRIRVMSDGRLDIKVYGAGEVVPALETFEAVSQGTVQMGHGAAYYWRGSVPIAQFFTAVPFGLSAQEMNGWLLHGGGMALWEELYAQYNLVPVVGGNTGVQMAGWFNKEINTLADLQGVKMRIPGFGGEVFEAAGGTAVNIPAGEIFTSLQTGVIDAAEWVGPFNDLVLGFHQVAKYYYYPGWQEPGPTLELIVNKEAFDALPSDLQEIVRSASQAVNSDVLSEYTARNNRALKEMVEQHAVEVRRLPDDVLAQLKKISDQRVAALVGDDPLNQRIYESYQGYRSSVMDYNELSERAFLNVRAELEGYDP